VRAVVKKPAAPAPQKKTAVRPAPARTTKRR